MRPVHSASGIRHVPARVRLAGTWRRPLKIVSAMVGVAALVFVAISVLAAHLLTMPRRHPLAEGRTPGKLGVPYEDVRLPAHGDGVEIAAWFLPSGESRRAIVLVHGKDASRTDEARP